MGSEAMTDPAEGPPKRSDHLATLKMHVDLANGEKQAIWTRHATMLVGNTIIAGARSGHAGVLLNILGLLLCGAWAWMTWVGWDEFHKSLRAGAAVPVEPDLNPLAEYSNPPPRWRDPIFTVANGVVVIFALIYVVGLCRALAH
jgi:hypothetical protein